MSPALATVLTIGVVLALVLGDTRVREARAALWLPVAWLLVTGSRFVSQWLDVDAGGAAAYEDSSPIDAAWFALLIVLGTLVLVRRREALLHVVRSNAWLVAFAAWGLLSIAWSDFPLVSARRWVKTLGHPVMVLVILTDPRPVDAFRIVMKRCAYVLLPCSVLFIKYLPELGRSFDPWTGAAANNGVGLTKNDLGYLCMVFGLFFLWNLLTAAGVRDAWRRPEVALSLAFLAAIAWLLGAANSATSATAFLGGASLLLLLRFAPAVKFRLGTYVLLAALVAVALQWFADPYAIVLRWLGRSPTLTDRTEVWADVLALQPNVLLGAGFESFWLGERLQAMWDRWWWHPNQAHNGYLETYLNLGLVGVVLLAGTLWHTFAKIRARLAANLAFADLRLAYLVAVVAFNFTESGFTGVHLVWTIFWVAALDLLPATGDVPARAISPAFAPGASADATPHAAAVNSGSGAAFPTSYPRRVERRPDPRPAHDSRELRDAHEPRDPRRPPEPRPPHLPHQTRDSRRPRYPRYPRHPR